MNKYNSFVTLRQVGEQWEFENEATLENFIWDNLHELLDLTPFKRQYPIKGQFCDILALDRNKSLIILELKNKEDRYIIQLLI